MGAGRRATLAGVALAALAVVASLGYYGWRRSVMADYIWQDIGSWDRVLQQPVDTSYPFDCTGGQLGTSDHALTFLNLPESGNPLQLVITDNARGGQVQLHAPLADEVQLTGIEYCEKMQDGQALRSYTADFHADDIWGDRHGFLIYDPKDGKIVTFGAEASALYSGHAVTIELYPFVRDEVFGRYAVQIAVPALPLPPDFANPSLLGNP